MNKLRGSAAMIAATLLWGVAFSAQSAAMRFTGPVVFTAVRSLIAALALSVIVPFADKFGGRRPTIWGAAETPAAKHRLLAGGLWCGVILALASTLQQYGLLYTTAGKTGFLTVLYIVIVPLLGILFGRKTTLLLWLAAALALAGAYLLCGGIGEINLGEWLVICAAFVYSAHILVIDHYAANCDCLRLSQIQFAAATLCIAPFAAPLGETWDASGIAAALPFLLVCGVGSGAIAFTLQMIAQKYLHPVAASLLMSLESVFAVLGGWFFLGEILSPRELFGCAMIFAAVILSQLPPGAFQRRRKSRGEQPK